jgi:site-specific DNA-cytosine methylase
VNPSVCLLFAGLGGASKGFADAGCRILAAVDNDPEACADHETITGHEAVCADLAEMTPQELRDACGGERPDIVFTSPPCKSFSGCLPLAKSKTDKYVELSSLAQRGIWLVLEAWPDAPVPLIVMENVPRIQTRGREWLDQTQKMLAAYGYVSEETTHDCGELGGLAQHRRRFLMVARHRQQVPEFLYEPPKQRVRGIGEVLGELPVPTPDSDAGGPMHHLPRLSAINWVRLALIPAGGDWHDIPDEVAISQRDARHNGGYGVNAWEEGAHTVVAEGSIQNTWASVQDPRIRCAPRATAYGIEGWSEAAGTVVGAACHDNGPFSVADPRVTCHRREGSMGVTGWCETSTAVIANGTHHNGPWQVADPRLGCSPYRGFYYVHGDDEPSHTVIGDFRMCKGANVVDGRLATPTHLVIEREEGQAIVGPELDLESRQSAKPVPVIRALDGTWHRPMTTLELAALQGFDVRIGDEWLELAGGSHKRWRQRIGNAVPPPAAAAIAGSCRATLDAARNGDFLMCGEPVWVDREREGVRP